MTLNVAVEQTGQDLGVRRVFARAVVPLHARVDARVTPFLQTSGPRQLRGEGRDQEEQRQCHQRAVIGG